MGAPKGNNFAKGNKGGNPGARRLHFVVTKITEHSEQWWKEWGKLMNGADMNDKKFAMSEYNKLQAKVVPQKIEDDNGNSYSAVLVSFIKNDKPTNSDRDTE